MAKATKDSNLCNLMDRMQKIGKIGNSSILSDSKFFNEKDMIQTGVPALNIALSGSLFGGLTPGLTILAGPSMTFKTCMSLKMVAAYLTKYPEAICLFYDSEFGVTDEYLIQMGVDTSRVLHIPLLDMEELKFDVMKKLKEIAHGDKVIILIDSVGNLASKKEADDALADNGAADMGARAKGLKSLFRLMTPHLTAKDIPCVAVNHSYKTLELYSKDVMSGGTGPLYSANTIFMITRSQDKDNDNKLEGFTFTIKIEKSRFVRAGEKIPLTVTFEDGVDHYSGILDIALEGKFISQPTKQTFVLGSVEAPKSEAVKRKAVEPLLDILLKDKEFATYIENRYKLSGNHIPVKKEEDDE
jgi:RecA/RadA recombinase